MSINFDETIIAKRRREDNGLFKYLKLWPVVATLFICAVGYGMMKQNAESVNNIVILHTKQIGENAKSIGIVNARYESMSKDIRDIKNFLLNKK